MLADVVELVDQDDVGVRLSAGVGHAPEGRDDRVVVVPEVAAGQDARAVDRDRLDHDHPGATEGPFAVVADVALTREAVLGHVRGVRPEGDPAAERAVPQRQRFEDVWERRPVTQWLRPALPTGCLPSGRRRASMRDDATDRRRAQDHEMDEEAEREGRIARDPEAVGDGDDRQLERADEPGPGRDDRDQRDAARQQRRLRHGQLDADRLAGGQERADRGAPRRAR